MTIAATASPLRVQATSRVSTIRARRELSLKGRCDYEEELLCQKVTGSNPGGAIFSAVNDPLYITTAFLLTLYNIKFIIVRDLIFNCLSHTM